eukprot:1137420-Pelagomonas_calceolata.AAC.3
MMWGGVFPYNYQSQTPVGRRRGPCSSQDCGRHPVAPGCRRTWQHEDQNRQNKKTHDCKEYSSSTYRSNVHVGIRKEERLAGCVKMHCWNQPDTGPEFNLAAISETE